MLLQQKFLGTGKGMITGSVIDQYFTNPLSENLSTISNFVFALVCITALVGALKVFKKMNHGEDDAMATGYRWFIAMVAFLIVWAGLKVWAQAQMYSSINF